MPSPWMNDGEQTVDGESDQEGTSCKKMKAPKYNDKLDFRTIDTHGYHKDSLHQRRNLGVVSSAQSESAQLDKWCDEHAIIMNPDNTQPPPDYGTENDVKKAIHDPRIIKNLQKVHIEKLNAVQQKCLQVIRDGYGIIVEAPTGIGKTYAFLIPAIEKAMLERKNRTIQPEKPSPTVLIIGPTANLAVQLFSRCELILGLKAIDEVEAIKDIKVDLLTASYHFNADDCDIAFCTMGKLKSTINDGIISLDNLKMIVLDEADKMVDGHAFGLDVEFILSKLTPEVMENLQSCFFSATFQRDINQAIVLTDLQSKMFHEDNWKLVYLPKMSGYISTQVIKIERPRDFYTSSWLAKMKIVRNLIDNDLKTTGCKQEGPYKETITIFCETIGRVAQVSTSLRIMGYNFEPVCRTLTKTQQQVTLNDLEFKKIQGIVCTNVMARGIDVSSVKHTIIMEMSNDFDTYKHRIGRVGRDGCGGKATVLIDELQLMTGPLGPVFDELYNFMDETDEKPEWFKEWYKLRTSSEDY